MSRYRSHRSLAKARTARRKAPERYGRVSEHARGPPREFAVAREFQRLLALTSRLERSLTCPPSFPE